MHNTKEKTLKAKEKCGMIGWANPCISCLTYARLQVCMMKLETMSETMLKKNGCVNCLNCFPEFDLILFQQIAWKEQHMPPYLGEGVPSPTSNESRRGMDQKCWHLPFPI
jgi:hypothetical protein